MRANDGKTTRLERHCEKGLDLPQCIVFLSAHVLCTPKLLLLLFTELSSYRALGALEALKGMIGCFILNILLYYVISITRPSR